jgi:beta-glucosidase
LTWQARTSALPVNARAVEVRDYWKDQGMEQPIDQRVNDLLDRMTLPEKAGMLFQIMIIVGSGDLSEPNSTYRVSSPEHLIKDQLLTHFNVIRAADDPRTLAEWHNQLQELASGTRLASQ